MGTRVMHMMKKKKSIIIRMKANNIYEKKIITTLFLHDISFLCFERMHIPLKMWFQADSLFYQHFAGMNRGNKFQTVVSCLPLVPAHISDAVFQHTIMKLQFAESEMILYITYTHEWTKEGRHVRIIKIFIIIALNVSCGT